ncbi:exodeoxyribonuclease VII large subunit [Legionella pneumophila]|nr:exodeoxyribonuclease VII large subunit [Legionella pneumophila]
MSSQLPILTVSQLNRQVKGFLENEIGLVHVEGEISNLSKPSSGHYYFTLKDSTAQIRCAFLKIDIPILCLEILMMVNKLLPLAN